MRRKERDVEGSRSSSRRRRRWSPSDSDSDSDSGGSPRRGRSRHRRRSRRKAAPSSSSSSSGASDSQASGSGSDSGDHRRRRSGSAKRGGVIEEQILEYMSKKAQKKAEKVAKKMKANAVSGYSNDSNPFGDPNLTEKCRLYKMGNGQLQPFQTSSRGHGNKRYTMNYLMNIKNLNNKGKVEGTSGRQPRCSSVKCEASVKP
ncbi:cactin-like [Triticum dicoccoides]|uniref:cactin-like n=1 Tax=Triticum dicoccoides TaxID=85692 RepID=UPI00188F70B3|nr:cactin-like [Triticum dicoccoides]